jgi:hypothetical protein
MPEDDQASQGKGAFSDAADRIRDSAKWLLGAFAAVGALLAAGLQLADLGQLAPDREDHRLQWAAVGVGAAILGIGIAIGAAASVVTRSFVSLRWLAQKRRRTKDLDDDKILLAGQADVATLYQNAAQAKDRHRQAVEEWGRAPTDPNLQASADARELVRYYDSIVAKTVEQASYLRLRRGFSIARAAMLLGAGLAAGGIALFAWAANPPAESAVPVVVATPTNVKVQFTTSGAQRFQTQLGGDCDLSEPLDAVAVRDLGTGYQLAVVPTASCNPALITVDPTTATVVPEAGGGP